MALQPGPDRGDIVEAEHAIRRGFTDHDQPITYQGVTFEGDVGYTPSAVTNSGDLYYSITLPALIMATFGGGTSLATQRECLELMGCYGKGKAYKLLEIAAGMVVAGELSLVSAARTDKETGTNEWVDAHEKLGRNR